MALTSRAAAAATLTATLTIGAPAHAAPTSPDHGFSGDGVLTLHSAAHDEALADMAVLPNGKTVLVVTTQDKPALEVHRLRANGSPDPTFGGGDGVFAFARASNYEDVRLAVDPSTGKSYVSTFIDNGSSSPTTVWRIRANGTLDKSYGSQNNGHVVINHRSTQHILARPGGRLLMAGNNLRSHAAGVWALNDKGRDDHPFGDGGKVVLSTDGNNDEATTLAPAGHGTVMVTGSHFSSTASTLLAYRLTASGAFDHTFSADGKASISPSSAGVTTSTVWPPQVLVRPDGRTVYVAGLNQFSGSFRNTLLVAGLTKAGKPDPGFGKHVYTGIAQTWGQSAPERDGKVVVAGFLPPSPSTHNAVVRFTTRGRLDPTWSGDGILPLQGASDSIELAMSALGRVLVGRSVGGGPFDTELRAMRGTTTPSCHGRLATQFGGGRADAISGTPRADVLVGLGGRDTLEGLGGNDVLCGNGGNDRLFGGPGQDTLVGGPGHDLLRQ